MLNEITLPTSYTGSLTQENTIISEINENFTNIQKYIESIDRNKIEFHDHIVDFEEYEIDLYYSDNKNKATIVLDDDIIVVRVAGEEIRINSNGIVV